MLFELFSRWPLIRQIRVGGDGTGVEAMSEATKRLEPRHRDTQVTAGVCPYCGVGCGLAIHHRDGQVVSIEGDSRSPISRGRLCPKGADTLELHSHTGRLTRVLYRPPYGTEWEEMDLERAMDLIADRVWESRERSFVEERDGQALMSTTAVAHLGGATLDNEENYLIKKLFTGGLGMVCVSNQARI